MDYGEASLIEKLSINLTDEKEQKLNAWINRNKESIQMDRQSFIARQKTHIINYDDYITYVRKGPFDGSSNVKMPLTSVMVQSYYSRLYNIFTQEDTTALIPRESMDDSYVNVLRELRRWYMWDHLNEYKGIRGVASEIFWDLTTVGFSVAMKSWMKKQRVTLDIEQNELYLEMQDMKAILGESPEQGKKVSIKPYKEVKKLITVFEGTRLFTIPFENIYFPNHIPESSDLDFPEMVLAATHISGSELNLKAKQGFFDQEKVDKVLNATSDTGHIGTRESDVKTLRDKLTGYDALNSSFDSDQKEIEYVFCSYDLDEDGVAEELVVTRSANNIILNVNYLDRVSKSGRPLFKFDCFAKPRQAYSRGVPEMAYSLQSETDLTHNMRLDYMQLQTCPAGVYRAGSSLDNQPIRLAPGKFIPVDDVNDLKTINFSTSAGLLAADEDRNMRYAELLLNVSPFSSGQVPSQIGPTRSTSGVVTLLQQIDKQMRPIIDRLAITWRKMELSILEDLDEKVPLELKERILGPIIKDKLGGKFLPSLDVRSYVFKENLDLRIDVASVVNSAEVAVNEASVIFQTLGNPTLYHQAGIIGPRALFKAASDFLKAYGRNPSDYLDEPEIIPKALTLYQEIQVCGQGEVPPMALNDDHQMKIQALSQFMQEPQFQEAKMLGLYVPDAEAFFQKTIQKHMTLLQATRPQGVQNPQGNQVVNLNAVQGGNAPQQAGGFSNADRPGNDQGTGSPEAVSSESVEGGSGGGGGAQGQVGETSS